MAEFAANLGWTGDGDDVDAIQEIDRAFALRLPTDLRHLGTVGDLWEIIEGRYLTDGDKDGGCHSAMAFYRLRAAGVVDGDCAARPNTALVKPPHTSWSAHMRALGQATGLRMPKAGLSIGGCLGIANVGMSGLAAWIGLLSNASAGGLAAAGVGLAVFAPRRLGIGEHSLGGLARTVAAMNPISLHRMGGRLKREELWRRMADILAVEAPVSPEQVGLATRFFPERRSSKRSRQAR